MTCFVSFIETYDCTFSVKLNMHIRDCVQQSSDLENRCYVRNTDLGYYETKEVVLTHLTFLSPDVELLSFHGQECFCQTDMCTPVVSHGSKVVISGLGMLLALVLVFFLT